MQYPFSPSITRSVALIVALTLCLILGVLPASAQDEPLIIPPDEGIVIGVSVGLSGEGIAPLGIDIQRGVELGLAEHPTVTIDGVEFTIRLDVQDSQCNAEGGVAVANRFSSDPAIIGVIGPMCSSACLPASNIYDAAGYSFITPSCTAAVLSRRGSTSFNRVVSPDDIEGKHTADYVYDTLGVRRVATLHDGSPYAEGLVDFFSELFLAKGGEIVAADAVTVGDTNFQALLSEIAETDPELIYFPGFPAEAARLIQQRFDVGLEDRIFFGGAAWKGPEVIELAGEAAEGAYAVGHVNLKGSDELEARRAAFLERYVETYGESPPQNYHFNGQAAFLMYHAAIEAVGRLDDAGNLLLNRADIAAFLRSYQNADALAGPVACGETGECLAAPTGVFQVAGGEFVLLDVILPEKDASMSEEAE